MSYKSNSVNILGLNIAKIKREELFTVLNNYLSGQETRHIVTANPEIILKAIEDEEYFSSVNDSALIIADGIGLKFAAWAQFENLYRMTGVELTKFLLARANEKNLKVAVLNWQNGLLSAGEIKSYIKANYNKIEALVINTKKDIGSGPKELVDFAPDILLCNFGFGEQEKFIFYNKNKIPNLKIAVGIGGTFDLLSGRVKRSPRIFRILGLEWAYRIIAQPSGKKLWRLKRLYTATFIFIYKFLKWRFILPWLYRPNVACIMYKKNGQNYQVLLVKRSDVPNHWQIPQGGTDGLPIKEAGQMEMSEELNTTNFVIKKTTGFITNYTFDKELIKIYKKGSKQHFGYKGQKQALCIAEFTGRDQDISINTYEHEAWQWVELDKVLTVANPIRHPQLEIFLNEFESYINNVS